MLFENIDNSYMDNFLGYIPKSKDTNSTVGFLRGNMFDDEFVPYKNMTYIKTKITSQRESELFEIMKCSFEINDYNLYLDLHPEDNMIFKKYKEVTEKLKSLSKMYEEKYGPLCIDNAQNSFKWIQNPWPWEKEDSKYV